MAGQPTPRKPPPSPNGAPTLTPLGHYAGRPDIALSRQVTVVGSKPGSRLHLASSTVSQSHAFIVNSAAGAYVRDLASRTHVFVNGKDHREADLNDGDLLQIGKFKFQFNAGVAGVGVEPGRSAPVGHFDAAPGALLNVEGGEMPLPIEGRTVLIGRRPTCDVPLIEDSVSTAHAIIFEMNGKRFIRDLHSRKGTFINGKKIDQQAELNFGDTIRIGETDIVYSSASGVVADHGEPDELDHLVSTAPLGTAALDVPGLADEDQGPAADDDAIPMIESEHGSRVAAAAPAFVEPARPEPDQVHLDSDPDVGGGPGDTAFLPPQVDEPRKVPTLKADLVANVAQPAAPDGEPLEAVDDAPAMPAPTAEEAALVDDVLGLTPEARRREAAKIDELSGSRRGWRGMQVDESAIPVAERPPAEDEPVAPAPPAKPPLAASRAEPVPSAEQPRPSATPQAEDEPAEEALPEEALVPAPIADALPVTEEAPRAPIAVDEDATAARQAPPPPHVTVAEEVDEAIAPLPAETFDIEIEEPSQLAVDETAASDVEDELHLPPVIDDAVDELELDRLPLTPEEGAPLDLSLDDTPAAAEEPPPSLDLKDPADAVDVSPPAAEPAPPAVGSQPEPSPAAVEREVEPESVAETPATEPESAKKKPKRVRTPRKKKGALEAEPAIAEALAPQPQPTPAIEAFMPPLPPPPVEAVAEAPADAGRDTVEVFDETVPTPESALSEDAVAEMLAEPLAIEESPAAPELTDTGFGRAVDSFVGESTGPLIESRQEEAPAEQRAAEEPVAEDKAAVEPVEAEELAEPELVGGPSDDEAAAIDDLVADVLAEEPKALPEKYEAPALDAKGIDTAIEELDLAAEEAADADAALSAGDTEFAAAPPEDSETEAEREPDVEPEPVAETAQPEPEPTVEDLEEPEPVAREEVAPPPPPPSAPPPPSKPAAPAPRAPAPMAWGPNQEHFLGGMPLKLNKPVKPAAGAGQAAARQNTPFMPAPPPRATRPNARTRSPFDIGPSDTPAENLGGTIPPFAGKSPKAGQITTGFDGLAMPPVRETDVFSQMGPGAFAAGLAPHAADDDDIFSRGARTQRQPPQQQQQQQQRAAEHQPAASPPPPPSAAPSAHSGSVDADAADADVPSPADPVWADDPAHAGQNAGDEPDAVGAGRGNRTLPTPPAFPAPEPAKRKRRWFGLRFLLIAMVLTSLAAAGAIYALVKEQTDVVGRLRFDNFPTKVTERDRLLKEQQKLVADHTVRDAAHKLLEQQHPNLPAGFLVDPVAYEAAARKAEWAAGQSGAFAFPYNGNDQHGDRQRVHAVMLALYDANTKGQGDGAGSLRKAVADLDAARDASQRRVNELKEQIERLTVTALKMPDRKRIGEVSTEVERLEKEHTAAARRVRDINLDLERMRQSLPANPQPAGTAQAPVVDPELAKLQEELNATNEKLASGKAARAKSADQARIELDAALASFEKQIASAQGLADDNPELSAYVAAAQKLQTETRELTDGLIRRQQEQQRRLVEMKTGLAEKLEARRADTWKRDPELKKLGDELAIVERQHSAAVSGGMKKEAEDLKAQVDLLAQMIKARQTLVGDDQFFADAINQLQKLIDDQQRSIDADRKHTEAQLERMQAAFTKTQPAVEKMPEAQQQLAASLMKQLEEINAARRKYNSAADAVAAASDEEMKKAEAAAAALAAKIETRRKALTAQAEKAATAEQEQGRLTALKNREAEFAAAQTAEAETGTALAAAQKALRELQSAEVEAREAGERRDALQTERVSAQKELEVQLAQLDLKRKEAGATVQPIPPTNEDVDMKVHDPRPTYALASVGGIVAVFVLLILLTSNGSAAAAADDEPAVPPVADLAPSADRIPPKPMPKSVDANGNGNGAAQSADSPRLAV